ncbi:ABC transporter permease [Kiritimatiella glycovorans]|uniref:MacB-like periplasmic core domain protein n=1 Tax=Kiritimatiella glycovorans TaxID=1307763 RepID=A0A0G3EET9_9BACT|nr:ABC transporter permease [Kiritimatiella glycovorans]AKJ64813.1 MacB-like periplasmic core domain protein [Kiritimatiella glycovorans]
MLPFGYAVRNLFRDPKSLFQAVLGSALVVLMVMVAAALNDGMAGVLSASGSPRNAILLGAGSEDSVLRSEISERAAGIAESSLNGLAEIAGVRAVSPEIHQMTLVSAAGSDQRQALVRGVTERAPLVYTKMTVTEGTFARPGGVMVGRLAWRRLGLPKDALGPGREIVVEDVTMTVAGVFAAPGTVMESEIWMDLNDLRSLSLRKNLSCVVLRLDGGAFPDVDLFAKQRLDLELAALRESDYFARLSAFYAPIRGMTWMTAILIATGALLGGLNTLYAAFSPRIREIATLQAIGYGRGAILFSLIQEATLAALCGAVVAATAAVLFLEGVAVSFSIGSFVLRVTPVVAAVGFGTGLGLGLVGAIPPGLRCLLPPVHEALRSAG